MALTITYDGYGVVANADSLTNDAGGSGTGDWRELGGGSYSLTPDASLYAGETPPVSIGSKYASKSGYTYIDGITPLDFSGGGTEEEQFIYIWIKILSNSPLDTLANNGLSIMIGSAPGDSYEYRIAGSDGANDWSTDWRLFVIDPTMNTGAIVNGTPDLSAIDTIGLWIDTATSVRAETFFISQIMCARGLKVEGTSDNLFDDIVAWCTDYANRAAGMFQKRGQTYYSLGALTIGDYSTQSANCVVAQEGANIEYEKSEFWNGTAWISLYPLGANIITVEEHPSYETYLTLENVGIAGNSENMLNLDTRDATDFNQQGGYLKYINTLYAENSSLFSGTVFSLYSARTLGAEYYENCTFDGSATLTVQSTSDFDANNTVNGKTGIISLNVANLAYIASTKLYSSGSNHGVELTSIGTGEMTWDCITDGFDVGVTGSPVTPTTTGGEDIYISATTGTLTINVADGATTPSIKSAGAVVNVVAGQKSFKFTLNPSLTNYEWRIYSVTALGSLAGAVELAGEETATADNQTYNYSYTSDIFIAVQIINQPDNDYVEAVRYFTLVNSNQDISINLEKDNNN